MKKILSAILAALLAAFLLAMPAFAEGELWNKSTNPFCDPDHILSEEDRKTAGRELYQSIPELEFDITVFLVTEKQLNGLDFNEYLKAINKQNERGYGVNSDGITLGLNYEKETFMIRTFGRGLQIFTEEEIRELSALIREGYRENGWIGAERAYHSFVSETVKASSLMYTGEETDYGTGYEMAEAGLMNNRPIHPVYDTGLPDWYLQGEDIESFEDFHNEPEESRIVDLADLLTEEEEKVLLGKIEAIRENYGMDLVVYTDNTSYGVDNELYSQDFYVFNGYGFGDTYDGMILFVNMDPENREMVTSTRGTAREHYQAEVSSKLDDILYDAFVEGQYGTGILNWADAVDEFFHFGEPGLPEWYRNLVDGTLPENASEEKLVDDLKSLSKEDKDRLEETLRNLSDTYAMDCVVYLTSKAYDVEQQGLDDSGRAEDFAKRFYEAMGYGRGTEKSGILLAIYEEESAGCKTQVISFGKAKEVFNEEVCERLSGIPLLSLSDKEYEKHIDRYLYYLNKTLKTGRLPHTWPVRIFWLILCLISGFLTSVFAYSVANTKMGKVAVHRKASAEMVPGSFRIIFSRDVFLGTKVRRTYLPKEETSSGRSSSSGSGRSSYSGSSRSSSGASFSSSRRKF